MPTTHRPPDRIVTERLVLRRWSDEDAAALKASIDASLAHLQAWMPWAMAEPTTLPDVSRRLAGFFDDFETGTWWGYGIWSADDAELLGGLGLHPREGGERDVVRADGRAPTCIEIGYWLRADATGRGYATEATRGAVAAGFALEGVQRVEIRCDPANERSLLVPRRLGFVHARTLAGDAFTPDGSPRDTMVWEMLASRW